MRCSTLYRGRYLGALLALGVGLSAAPVSYAELIYSTVYVAPGVPSENVSGINQGTIVGHFGDGYTNHGFYRTGNAVTTLDDPCANQWTTATGISGDTIVGIFSTGGPAGSKHGFVYSRSQDRYMAIDYPQAPDTQPCAVDGNTIVGGWSNNTGYYSFIYDGNTWSTIHGGWGASTATGISKGIVTGYYQMGPGQAWHGYTYAESDGQIATIDVPGATNTLVYGIDDGILAGAYSGADGNWHGFIQREGEYTVIDDPMAVGRTFAMAVSGTTVTGYYTGADGGIYGFVATEVPEPGSLSLLALTAVPLWMRRRRK